MDKWRRRSVRPKKLSAADEQNLMSLRKRKKSSFSFALKENLQQQNVLLTKTMSRPISFYQDK